MTIEQKEDEILVRLSKDVDIRELERMLKWLEYKSIVSKSKASQEDIDELIEEAKESIGKRFEEDIRKKRWI